MREPPSHGQDLYLLTTFGDGGVERMPVNLAHGLSHLGVAVDFIVKHARIPYVDKLPESVNLIEFGPGLIR